jgi:hypothetical protein
MSMQQSFTEPLRSISDITPEELQRYLREARRLRSQAFSDIVHTIGRLFARPFRKGERVPTGVAHSAR